MPKKYDYRVGANQMLALYQRLELLLWRCVAIQSKASVSNHQQFQRVMQKCVEMMGDARGQSLNSTWQEYVKASSQLLSHVTPHFVHSISPLIPHAEILRYFLEHNIFQPWTENGHLMGLVSYQLSQFILKYFLKAWSTTYSKRHCAMVGLG